MKCTCRVRFLLSHSCFLWKTINCFFFAQTPFNLWCNGFSPKFSVWKSSKGKRQLLKLFFYDSDTSVSSFFFLAICPGFYHWGIYIPCWWPEVHIHKPQTLRTFDNILLLILTQVWYTDTKQLKISVRSSYKFWCLVFCRSELMPTTDHFYSYLAILSQIPWPPYFAGSTGAPAFLTMILRVNRLPFIPAASSRRWISSERLRRKASASLGWKEKTCLDND